MWNRVAEIKYANQLTGGIMACIIEIEGIKYRKSSYSNSGGQFCVGVAHEDDLVLVTNTKTRGPVVRFTKVEWRAFIAGVKEHEFDLE
jgi:hypothetical protein